MHIIIVGCGKVGSNLAIELSMENHDVVIIENDPEKFKLLGSGFNGKTVQGVALDEDVLIKAGIRDAEALAAVTPDENMNVMVCQIAKEIFNVPRVIPRVYDPDRDLIFQQLGLNTMCLTTLAVAHVKKILSQKSGDIWGTFGNKSIVFRYLKAEKKHIGETVRDIESANNLVLFGVIKNDEFFLANYNLKINSDDILIIAEYF